MGVSAARAQRKIGRTGCVYMCDGPSVVARSSRVGGTVMLRSSTAQCITAHGAGAVCRIATWILAAVFRSIRCIHEFSVVAALGHLDVLPFCCQARHQSRARVHCRVSGGKQSPSEPLGGYVHALSKLRQCWRPWRLLCPPRERHGDLSDCCETKHEVYSVRGSKPRPSEPEAF